MQIIGWLAVVLTAVQFIPQVVKAYTTKELKGASLATFVMIVVTASTWIVHGILHSDSVVIAANSLVLISAIAIVMLKLKYPGN